MSNKIYKLYKINNINNINNELINDDNEFIGGFNDILTDAKNNQNRKNNNCSK